MQSHRYTTPLARVLNLGVPTASTLPQRSPILPFWFIAVLPFWRTAMPNGCGEQILITWVHFASLASVGLDSYYRLHQPFDQCARLAK